MNFFDMINPTPAERRLLRRECLRRAGLNYEQAGLFLDAAECWVEYGEPGRAAECLLRVNDYAGAGDRLWDAGRYSEALEAYRQSRERLADDDVVGRVRALLGMSACWGRLERRSPEARRLYREAHALIENDAGRQTVESSRCWALLGQYGHRMDRFDLVNVGYESALARLSGKEAEERLSVAKAYRTAAACDRLLSKSLDVLIAEWTPTEEVGQEPPKSITNSLGMEFVWIPPGTFMMGSPEEEPERYDDEVQHEVTLTKGFYLQTTQVTQGQWEAVMGDNPSRFTDGGPDCPVEQVSWEDAQRYIEKLNERGEGVYRLPTEAEWEYACRAGTKTALYNGPIEILGTNNAPALDPIAWYGGNSGVDYESGYDSSGWSDKQYPSDKSGTHPVGLKQPNPWGLYDMIGNVLEWCQDRFGDYPSGPVTDPVGPDDGVARVLRGGGWRNPARNCRSAYRSGLWPGSRGDYFGFRLVLRPGH